MINVWDNIATDELSKPNNWMIFKWFLKALKLRKTPSKVLKSLLPSKFGYHKENQKFPSLNKNDICEKCLEVCYDYNITFVYFTRSYF